MDKKKIKKYDLTYCTYYNVEVVATSLEEAKELAAENIEESSKYECCQDLWDSLEYESHTVSNPDEDEIEEYLYDHGNSDDHDDE